MHKNGTLIHSSEFVIQVDLPLDPQETFLSVVQHTHGHSDACKVVWCARVCPSEL